MKLATKLSLAMGALAMAMAGLGIFCVMQIAGINDSAKVISMAWLPRGILAEEMNFEVNSCRRTQLRHVIAKTQQEMTEIEEELKGYAVAFDDKRERLKARLILPEAKRLVAEVEKLWTDYRRQARLILDLSKQNKTDEAIPLLTGKSRDNFLEITSKMADVVKMATNGANTASEQSTATYTSSRTMVLVLICIAVAASQNPGPSMTACCGRRISWTKRSA